MGAPQTERLVLSADYLGGMILAIGASIRNFWLGFRGFLGRRVVPVLLVLFTVGLVCWLFRAPALRVVGSFLITEDTVPTCDALYVLGGAPLERGMEAARLLQQGVAPWVYCTGENIPHPLLVEGLRSNEAELSRRSAIQAGADSTRIALLPEGTSTWEESAVILEHARKKGFATVTVLSTEFHLRRVGRVFRKRFKGSGIAVHFRAAPSLHYDPQAWWKSEEGLLMVNNEYVKLCYYLVRY